jgi:hypothetical protein
VFRKFWAKFILGHHVNYFDIRELQGVGCGSTQYQHNSKHEPFKGPHPPWCWYNSPTQYLVILDNIHQTQASISIMIHTSTKNNPFIYLSHQVRYSSNVQLGDRGGQIGILGHAMNSS